MSAQCTITDIPVTGSPPSTIGYRTPQDTLDVPDDVPIDHGLTGSRFMSDGIAPTDDHGIAPPIGFLDIFADPLGGKPGITDDVFVFAPPGTTHGFLGPTREIRDPADNPVAMIPHYADTGPPFGAHTTKLIASPAGR